MLLQTQHLTGGYKNHSVVHNLDLSLKTGEWLSLVGANGSGKSTLLKLLSQVMSPQKGVVMLDGVAIHTQSAQAVAQQMAFLQQQQTIPAGLTVQQLVRLGRSPHQPWWQWEMNSEDQHFVEIAIAQVRLTALRNRWVDQLSGGERQRAFLALALAQNPKVLLLDEPTTFLDVRYQLDLLELLREQNRNRGLSIITVLHEINLAARYSDRLAMIKAGRIAAIGTPSEVLTQKNLAHVFGIQAIITETAVGLMICAIAPCTREDNIR